MPEILRRISTEIGEGLDVGFLMQAAADEEDGDNSLREELLRHLRILAIENELEQLGAEIKSLDRGDQDDGKLAHLLQHKQALARDLVRLKNRNERI